MSAYPTPWWASIQDGFTDVRVRDDNGNYVCTVGSPDRDRNVEIADFIIARVNAHDALVSVCQSILRIPTSGDEACLCDTGDFGASDWHVAADDVEQVQEQARAALALC